MDGWRVISLTAAFSLSQAPCVPENIQNDLECLSGVLNVTWQSTGYVVQFHTSVVSGVGHVGSCRTERHHCVVHNVQCGQTYDITVLAQDEACNSSYSPTKQLITGLSFTSLYVSALWKP